MVVSTAHCNYMLTYMVHLIDEFLHEGTCYVVTSFEISTAPNTLMNKCLNKWGNKKLNISGHLPAE